AKSRARERSGPSGAPKQSMPLCGDAAMSPGPINLPFWVWLVYFDVAFWYLTVPIPIGLMLVGWYGADWLRGFRWAAFGAAALLALPFPIVAVFIAIGEIR